MAWPTLPTFTAKNVLYSANMNLMVDALAYLKNPTKARVYRTGSVDITATSYTALSWNVGALTINGTDPNSDGHYFLLEAVLQISPIGATTPMTCDFTFYRSGSNINPAGSFPLAQWYGQTTARITTIPLRMYYPYTGTGTFTFEVRGRVGGAGQQIRILPGSQAWIRDAY